MKKLKILYTLIFATLAFGQVRKKNKPTNFLPKGYVSSEKINDDSNKDGIEDCVLLIKGTDKSKIIKDGYREKLERNRREIIVLIKKKDCYDLAVQNYNCFSSENEDNSNYHPPELLVKIKKGNLTAHFGHARYEYWRYTFRFQKSAFVLIGYDVSNRGVVIESATSINFIIKKKQ